MSSAGSYWEEGSWDEEVDPAQEEESEGASFQHSLALGLLAMWPLLLAYELALASAPGVPRNSSELVLFYLFDGLGSWARPLRWISLVVAMSASLLWCLRRHWALGPRLFRIAMEGLVCAVLLGPILVGITLLVGEPASSIPLGADPRAAPNLVAAGLVFGGGAYEEIVFRVLVYCALYAVFAGSSRFLGAAPWLLQGIGEVGALIGQALLFAAFHLSPLLAWLGEGGEDFDVTTFVYRTIAGLFLGILFRLRGPGVCAWTHGLFNLALLLGAGPDVLL